MRDEKDPGTAELPLPGQLIGYARVSTADQDMALQLDALRAAGCARIFTDVASGTRADRPGLDDALAYLRQGDTFVVWKLDRAGRSFSHLVQLVETLRERGIGLRSLTDGVDSSTTGGRMVIHLFAVLAEFERGLNNERTRAGLAVARAQGRTGGRRPVITAAKLAQAQKLIGEKGLTVREAATRLKVGKTALYKALAAADEAESAE